MSVCRQRKIESARSASDKLHMPLLPLAAAFVLGKATGKKTKKQAVSKYKRKNGTRVKAYTRKAKTKVRYI